MNDENLIRLSQAHLNTLETCPPQFQRLYLDQLSSSTNPEQLEKITWGSQFHLLMQQHALGLSVQDLVFLDQSLIQSLQGLLREISPIWDQPNVWQEAEHHRTLTFENYLLTAVYDLLILEENSAHILDWKTYPKPEQKDRLVKNWQTRLYPYILAETSSYLPKQISMTYWFVQLPDKPQSITFKYDLRQHQKNQRDLQNLIKLLSHYLESYQNNKLDFPHHSNCETFCPNAAFLWAEKTQESLSQQLLQELDSIEEVMI